MFQVIDPIEDAISGVIHGFDDSGAKILQDIFLHQSQHPIS